MRPSISIALIITAATSALALWRPTASPIVAAVNAARDRASVDAGFITSSVPNLPPDVSLPAQIPVATIDLAERDPFVPVQAPAPPPIVQPAPASPIFYGPPAPPAPVAPQMNYRFVARMLTPAGDSLVYLTNDLRTVAVNAGDALEDGYVVESITPENVTLAYPPLGVRMLIPLPAEPVR